MTRSFHTGKPKFSPVQAEEFARANRPASGKKRIFAHTLENNGTDMEELDFKPQEGSQYTEDNIRHLDDMEHIRLRSGMYIARRATTASTCC